MRQILLILAILCFALAALKVQTARVDLVAAGLAFYAMASFV